MSTSELTRSDLQPYQERAIEWIRDKPNCALWVEMGLGKTVTTLTAIADLMNDFEVNRVLVIAPLRVAEGTWDAELKKWQHLPELRVSHILGDAQTRTAAMRADADLYIINRENVAWLVAQHFNEKPVVDRAGNPVKKRGRPVTVRGTKHIRPWIWDVVVLDESSSFKSYQAKRFKELRFVRKLFPRMIQLTGTPSPNGLMDIWTQIYLLDQGERLGKTITAYRNRWWNEPGINQFKYTLKTAEDLDGNTLHWAEDQIQYKIKDICLTLREKDYLDLPPVIYNSIKVRLSDEEMEAYREFKREAIMEIKGKVVTAVNAGVLTGKLLQLSNGAVYTEHPEWETFHDAKLRALEEFIDVTSGPVIVVYNFQSDLKRISKLLRRMKASWAVLDSKKVEDRWNAGEIDVLVLHPASAGHGLNLQFAGSENMVWFGLNWSLELYQQAVARIAGGHRRQGRSVVIHHIITEDTYDERVVEVLADKDATQERLLEVTKMVIKND